MSVLTLVTGKEDRTLRRIRVSDIARNPNQPRKYFDPEAIAQLAESIRQYGVLNPLTVRRAPNGGYELVAGERRLRAARVAGLNEVPCLVIAADSQDSSAIALVENLQRRDLDFFEEANGFKRLIDQYGLTQEEAARKVGKTQSAVDVYKRQVARDRADRAGFDVFHLHAGDALGMEQPCHAAVPDNFQVFRGLQGFFIYLGGAQRIAAVDQDVYKRQVWRSASRPS